MQNNIRAFTPADTEDVVKLWQLCGLTRPWNDPYKDIARKRKLRDNLFLLMTIDGKVAGSVMGGYEGHRGWINYLAVDPAHQRRGLGRELMDTIEQRLLALDCPKINLQVREANAAVVAFYNAIGFADDEVKSFGKRLIPDN